MTSEKPKVTCLKCRHYYVTWDTHFPKGCLLFKFKTRSLPSTVVYEATGAFCEHYTEKTKTK